MVGVRLLLARVIPFLYYSNKNILMSAGISLGISLVGNSWLFFVSFNQIFKIYILWTEDRIETYELIFMRWPCL